MSTWKYGTHARGQASTRKKWMIIKLSMALPDSVWCRKMVGTPKAVGMQTDQRSARGSGMLDLLGQGSSYSLQLSGLGRGYPPFFLLTHLSFFLFFFSTPINIIQQQQHRRWGVWQVCIFAFHCSYWVCWKINTMMAVMIRGWCFTFWCLLSQPCLKVR